jgi:hypothetical protein
MTPARDAPDASRPRWPLPRGLLGLPPLSGSALTAAATLNGAMTGTL